MFKSTGLKRNLKCGVLLYIGASLKFEMSTPVFSYAPNNISRNVQSAKKDSRAKLITHDN
jgi:hypothetical protein